MNNNEKNQALSSLAPLLGRVREQRPLVHHITNMVVMNDTANITLAIGASPVMAHALEEVEEMVNWPGCCCSILERWSLGRLRRCCGRGSRLTEFGFLCFWIR